MLNIRLYKKLATPKTWEGIINYDSHEYKDDDLISEDDTCENFCLLDNKDEFEHKLKQYRIDLKESYLKEEHIARRKNTKEINKEYYSSGIMRSFRLSINHIETNSLHKLNDDEETRKQNIINFYKLCLDEIQKTLNKNNRWKQKVLIIKADLHFDQTNPHIHLHISNLRNKYSKRLKRNSITCNMEQSDLIRILKKEQARLKNSIKVNELFTQSLKKSNKEFNLDLINRVDLKRLYPEIYDVLLYKQKNNIQNIDLKETVKNGELKDSYEGINHRLDKNIAFKMTKKYLNQLNLDSCDNHIDNRKKLSNITLYCWKQSLALQTAKEQKLEFDKKQESNQIEKNIKFELDLTKINNNKYINEMLDRSMNNDELSMHIIRPLELKDMNKDCLLSNISKYCPELQEIEKELHESLGLFKNMNLNDRLNNTNFINNIKTDNLEYIDRSKLEITNNNLDANNNLTSTEYLQANDFKKKSKSNDFELDLDDETFNKNYFVKKELEIDYSTKKQINVTDIEKQEEIEKLKRTRSLSI